ncbi:MAG: glycosyltransferase family 39 protein [bacterium]|nr:MAG: glycosyltransferase family 39 protein [bacterium]
MNNFLSESKVQQIALLVLTLLVGFFFRFINLTGDAPAGDISRSGVFYVDEGTYAHNVVNKALFDQWFLKDDYNAISNVPIFSMFQYAIVKIFGVGLAQIRFGGIFYSLLSLLLLWLILKSFDPDAAWIAFILGAGNYFFIIYNRLALLENLLILFLVIIFGLLFLYHKRQRLIWLVLATTCFVAGYFVKATVIFFVPVILITIYLTNPSWKMRLRHFIVFLTILFLLAIGGIYFWILPHQEDWLYFQQLNISLKLPDSPLQLVFNYARYIGNLKLFPFMPVTYAIFLYSVGWLIVNLIRKKEISFPEVFFMTWALSGILLLGFFAYSPPRFSLILIPAVVSLVAIFLTKMKQHNFYLPKQDAVLIVGIVALMCCSQIAFGFYRIIRDQHHYLSCYLPFLSLVVPGFLYWANKKLLQRKISYSLLISIIVINLAQIGHYHFTIKYSYYNAMRDMKYQMDQYPKQPKVLAGDIAPLVATELKMKAVNIIFLPQKERNRFLYCCPAFLVLQDRKQLIHLQRKMPEYLADIQLLKSYCIFNNYINKDNTYFFKINAQIP